LRKLQIEVCKLQEWVRHEGLRIIVIFEGRDAARKGGAIKAITRARGPRVFRVTALSRSVALNHASRDPLRQWKLSAMDLTSRSKWYASSRARDLMLEATDRQQAPW
jgi:polyphosphate kinase 2 (PPK2 family)